jgi:hypothetical protein
MCYFSSVDKYENMPRYAQNCAPLRRICFSLRQLRNLRQLRQLRPFARIAPNARIAPHCTECAKCGNTAPTCSRREGQEGKSSGNKAEIKAIRELIK